MADTFQHKSRQSASSAAALVWRTSFDMAKESWQVLPRQGVKVVILSINELHFIFEQVQKRVGFKLFGKLNVNLLDNVFLKIDSAVS
jgi:aspartate/glutamate racemase